MRVVKPHIDLVVRLSFARRLRVVDRFCFTVDSRAALSEMRALNGDIFVCVLASVGNCEITDHDVVKACLLPSELQLCSLKSNIFWTSHRRGGRRARVA